MEKNEIQFMNAVIFSYQIPKMDEVKINKQYMFCQEYIDKKNPAIVVIFGYKN